MGVGIRDASVLIQDLDDGAGRRVTYYTFVGCGLNRSGHCTALTVGVLILGKDKHMLATGGQAEGVVDPTGPDDGRHSIQPFAISVGKTALLLGDHMSVLPGVTVETKKSNCMWDARGTACTHAQPVSACWYDGPYANPTKP